LGLPQPLTRTRVCPPPPFGSEGVGESQFRRGDRHRGALCIYVLCGINQKGRCQNKEKLSGQKIIGSGKGAKGLRKVVGSTFFTGIKINMTETAMSPQNTGYLYNTRVMTRLAYSYVLCIRWTPSPPPGIPGIRRGPDTDNGAIPTHQEPDPISENFLIKGYSYFYLLGSPKCKRENNVSVLCLRHFSHTTANLKGRW
jgi:hypothetical protein